MINKFKDYLASRAYVLFTVIVLASVTGIGYSIIKLDRDNHRAAVRHDIEQALYLATDQIRLHFFEAVLVANKIERHLTAEQGIDEKPIARIVDELRKTNPGVMAVALAPGLKVSHSFPQMTGNPVVGLKYWEVPEQLPSVARAYRSRSPVVDGPVNLVQGGTGFILRYPVFLPDTKFGMESFWGIISVVMKADGLFSAQQHDFGNKDQYIFALRELSTTRGMPASAMAGMNQIDDEPVTAVFSMLGNTWQAKACPTDGWPSYSPQSPYLLGVALLSALVMVWGLWAFRALAVKKANAHALLSEAIDCIDEGFIAFDDKERLVIVNQKYLDYHPKFADFIVPGKSMQELLREGVKRGQYPAAEGREGDWIADRMERFRHPGGSFLQDVGGNRWLKITEAKTPHGYTVGIRTDVSAEIRAQESAEAADREKTEFLNNVSHELRTPLTVISGRAAFLRNADKLPQSQQVQAALETERPPGENVVTAVRNYQRFVTEQGAGIAHSAFHMLRLVEDLLDWTKVARGQLELDLELIQLGLIAQAVVEDLQPDAAAKGLTLTFESGGPAHAMVDEVRLKQILYNLTSNAIKFTDQGSIHVSMNEDDNWVHFSVTDTGCGISEENIGRVFQRFQQVDGSMARRNGGLGLGLAIASQLADLHGGSLSVYSQPGEGSTFRLSLPRKHVIALRKTA